MVLKIQTLIKLPSKIFIHYMDKLISKGLQKPEMLATREDLTIQLKAIKSIVENAI